MRRRTTIPARILLPAMLAFALLAAGCAGWRGVREPVAPLPPDSFALSDTAALPLDGNPWWTLLGDSTLNALMDSAFAGNWSLRAQVARLEQARQRYIASRASWFPSLSASGSYTRRDVVEEPDLPSAPAGSSGTGGASINPGSFVFGLEGTQVQLNAAYELDLFGGLKAQRSAARADWRASEHDLRAFVLSFSGQLARSWYGVVELRLQEDLLERTLSAYAANLELVEERYRRGVAPSVDMYQARTNLADIRAQLAANRNALAAAEHALVVLLGEMPGVDGLPAAAALPDSVPPVNPGLPSEILNRRPDVAAAMQRLVAADRRAASAVADLYPSFTLSGGLSGFSEELTEIADPGNLFWNAVASVSAPIFQGGRLRANARAQEAAWRAALADYRGTLLTAFQEVENALAWSHWQEQVVQHRRTQAASARASLRLAEDRYLRGVSDYLQVVVAQTGLFNAERALIRAKRELVESRVAVATAVAGRWTELHLDMAEERDPEWAREETQ